MPELPEVETIVRQLRAAVLGCRLQSVEIRRSDVVRSGDAKIADRLRGRCIRQIRREGKRIELMLAPAFRMVFHLGMSGRLLLQPTAEATGPHTHVRVLFENSPMELRFQDPRRFGGVWLIDDSPAAPHSAGPRPLGPDPLEISKQKFRTLLQRDRQIKALLMDQQVIAGLGNIYCDESLHRAAIHPLDRASDLSSPQRDQLWRAIRTVLKTAIAFRGTTLMDYRSLDGSAGSFQSRHRVYHRTGQPCAACKTPIVRIQAAGRSTHLCPKCQPLGSALQSPEKKSAAANHRRGKTSAP